MPSVPTIEHMLTDEENAPVIRFGAIESVRQMIVQVNTSVSRKITNVMFGIVVTPSPSQDGTIVMLFAGTADEITQSAVDSRRNGKFTGVPDGSMLVGVFGLYGVVDYNAGFRTVGDVSDDSDTGHVHASVVFPDYGMTTFWMRRDGEVPMVASTHSLTIDAVKLTPQMVDQDSVVEALRKFGQEDHIQEVIEHDEEVGQSALNRIMTALKTPDDMLGIIAQ